MFFEPTEFDKLAELLKPEEVERGLISFGLS